MGNLVVEQLEFDLQFGCPFIEAEYYREGAEDLIRKLLPMDLLEASPHASGMQRARFADMLPLICWSNLEKAPCSLSVLLLCKYRLNACNFFCDMISRWLLPQRRINVELFFTSDVRLPHLSDELLSVAEVVVYLRSASEVEEVRRNLHAIETEIRLGVVSTYHARRILEFKGLSSDGKTAMIQEKIGSLMQSHSKDYDQGIFSQMQQFLVNCPEDFKKIRDYHHISRIISNLHSVRKLLKQNVDVVPLKRHIILKFLKTRLTYPKGSVKEKSVLGILAGLNFLREHEVFQEEHLAAAVRQLLPQARLVLGSYIVDQSREHSLQTVYLEMEKIDGSDFRLEEIQKLKHGLADPLKGHIEQLTHPIYMPRNEEEVLRNIMALSRQIRFVNDLPQVIISFEETRGRDLYFTVILLRISEETAPSVQELFAKAKIDLKYIPDRVRTLGTLRRKYSKEATVFRTVLASDWFLRSDRSVDLYKARQHIFQSLCSIIGEIRDYNGGMILKQNEQLMALKSALGKSAQLYRERSKSVKNAKEAPCNLSQAKPTPKQLNLKSLAMQAGLKFSGCPTQADSHFLSARGIDPMLVEKFFHSLLPMEMRTSCDIEPLKQLFLLFLSSAKHGNQRLPFAGSGLLFKQEPTRIVAVLPSSDGERKRLFLKKLETLRIAPYQLVRASLDIHDVSYLGFILLSCEREAQNAFVGLLTS